MRVAQIRVAPQVNALLGPVFVAILYYAGALGAFMIGTLSDRIFAPFWPPNVILFCALALVPEKRWPLYFAAVLPAHIVAEMFVGMAPLPMAVAFVTNCALSGISAYALRRLYPPAEWFSSFTTTLTYIVIAAGAVPAIVGLAGAFVPILGGESPDRYWAFWPIWYFGNALAFLTVAPLFLIWFTRSSFSFERPARVVEAMLVGALLVLICAYSINVGGRIPRGLGPSVLYLPLPLIVWAAVRFGVRGASAAVLIVAIVSTWATVNGRSVFLAETPEETVLAMQVFLTGIAIVVLLLGASIDQLRLSEERTRWMAGSLMKAQDEERRRIAREMHDTTGQQLIGAKMLIDGMRSKIPDPQGLQIDELHDLVEQSIRDLRTASYLLHPPLLDEAGLRMAIEHYVEGYVQRTGIKVTLDIGCDSVNLPKDTEVAVFHVIREALTNISRHAQSATASVSLRPKGRGAARRLVLIVEDSGKGIAGLVEHPYLLGGMVGGSLAEGVGLRSMRERLHQVGARLMIESRVGKTTVSAAIPIDAPARARRAKAGKSSAATTSG